MLTRLTEAETGRHRPRWCGRRYVVVEYLPDDPADADDASGSVVGGALSLYHALDLLASLVEFRVRDFPWWQGLPGPDAGVDAHADWLGDRRHLAPTLAALRSPARRLLAYQLLGAVSGAMDVTTATRCWPAQRRRTRRTRTRSWSRNRSGRSPTPTGSCGRRAGRVRPGLTGIDDRQHWLVLRALLDAGADAVDVTGATLLDRALAAGRTRRRR